MYVYRNGTVEGGFCKRGMIQSALEVTFHPPALHELIDNSCFMSDTSDAKRFLLGDESSSQFYAAAKAEHHTL